MNTPGSVTERLAQVRARFAFGLEGKIADSFAALNAMAGGGDTADVVVIAHRQLHELCGIAPTLGFAATGKAARSAETVIRGAAKSRRVLTPVELAALQSALDALRNAVAGDLCLYSSSIAAPSGPESERRLLRG